MSSDSTTLLLVRPANFGPNAETAANNVFQHELGATDAGEVRARAQAEFDAAVQRLQAAGLNTIVIEDTEEPRTTDAVFPNNWISFHEDGTVVLYPMEAPTRRKEVRTDLLDSLARHGLRVERILDWSPRAEEGRYLEGTGSLVLDRRQRVAYAARSSRTDPELARELCDLLGYELVLFDAVEGGRPIYHTNVLMGVGHGLAVACVECLSVPWERRLVEETLARTDNTLLAISREQMRSFLGNVLIVAGPKGDVSRLILSETAAAALTIEQQALLEPRVQLVPLAIPTIERYGGGSARCMLAEVALPPVAD